MQTVFTAYFCSPYDTGMILVGTFSTRQKAEDALKDVDENALFSTVYTVPKILVQTLDVIIAKTDDDPTINAILNLENK